MKKLSSKERLINTFNGETIDRIATYDIIHNVELIEHLSGEKLTPKNAEDITCKAVSSILDLVRHFNIPKSLEPEIIKEDDGFIYKYEWWTGTVLERPFNDLQGARKVMEEDIEDIYKCIDEKKICKRAHFHCRLFGEDFEYLEELKNNFRRIVGKLDGTIMIAPESAGTIVMAEVRYDYIWWTYLYYDYPELALKYLDAIIDYELARIESFADSDLTPISFTSETAGLNDSLLHSLDFNLKISLPRVKKLVARWKELGYYHIYFADGYKWPILDEVISWDLVDAIDPFEPLAHMDIVKFRNKYPGITVCQPIDCQNLLFTGTPAEIEKATIKAIEDAEAEKIIIGSSSEIHPNVPVENAIAMYKTAREYKL